ncbi:MAG: peptide chain release factor N(5)-glutamine methyltransferase [Capnocytophaga sp.]|nr:peptide chain release factor N(5)-glutamine methyltransferase [Capnocytophaga sp.]
MNYSEIKKIFHQQLKEKYIENEIDSLFFIALENVANISRIEYFLQKENIIYLKYLEKLEFILQELKKNKPIQYIINNAYFYGLNFYVDENVLIPRQETNELVDWVLNSVDASQPLKILDIGTGSGCIAIALKKNLPFAEVSAIDISEKAIEVAQKNAQKNQVRVNFLQKNILQTEHLLQKWNIIISNPPYVQEKEKAEIQPNVLDNEPHLALFVPDDNPLLFYEKITELAKKNLTENGILFFEINQYLSKETKKMIENKGFSQVILKKDLQQNDRMILAKL